MKARLQISASALRSAPLRTLIVDCNESDRREVKRILEEYPQASVIRESSHGLEAMATAREFKPEVLFCEVQIPGLDGFALLETLPPTQRPAVVFLSRSKDFAAHAFEVSAVDYVLKPISSQRLLKAFERARNVVESSIQHPSSQEPARAQQQLVIRSGRSVIFVKPEELDWVEAEGKYVRLHMGKEFLTLKMSISSLETQLDPSRFVRIHRSTLINVDRIRRVQPWDRRRTYQVTLQDGTRLVLSRKDSLREISANSITSLPETTY